MIALTRCLRLVTLAFLFAGSAACSSHPERVGIWDLAARIISGNTSVYVKDGNGFSTLRVVVTVDKNGRVTDAHVDENLYKLDPGPGLTAARSLTFTPLIFEGRLVESVGAVEIEYWPHEIPPDTSIPFPVAPLSDFEITLERSACYGSCPDYRVSISGDGRVRYSSRESRFSVSAADVHLVYNGTNVLLLGPYESQVDTKSVGALVAKFRAAHFVGMRSEYVAAVTDSPTYALTLRAGKMEKRVTDYVGRSAGMPAIVKALEDAVDTLAGSERWVRGNEESVAILKAQSFDFKSHKAADLVERAMILGFRSPESGRAARFVRAMLANGLDVSAKPTASRQGVIVPIGAMIVKFAVDAGDEHLLDDMIGRGYLGKMDPRQLDEALRSGMGCNPAIAKKLIAAGANPKAGSPDGNALHQVRESYGACADAVSGQRVEMVKTLVALGVPLEARDGINWTPLMGSLDPEVAKVLIAAGANVNAKDEKGTTPALSTDDDRVLLLLLQAGADPRAKDDERSVRAQANKRHMSASLAWLDAHGVR